MQNRPLFIMKCSKCQREFPADATYCESCSSMLEPFEIDNRESAEPLKVNLQSPENTPDSFNYDKIDEIRIDSLKADIQGKLIYTLLTELGMLKRRLSEQEGSLDELQERESEIGHLKFLSAVAEKEKSVDGTIKKISKIESTLEGLKKTIEADIERLQSELKNTPEPGFFWFINKKKRYYRILNNELKIKQILMDILLGRKSPDYFRIKRQRRIYLLIALSVILTLIVSWQIFTYKSEIPADAVQQPSVTQELTAEKTTIREEQIIRLLEDIKRANLSKDITLWQSGYSSDYLKQPGKMENILKLWGKIDYTSLEYNASDIRIYPDRASALVTWEMGLKSLKTGREKSAVLRLMADFIMEDGRLKISSVRKAQ